MQRRGIARLALSSVLARAGLAWPALAQTAGDLRLALVIGNAAYPGDAALGNAVNDAQAMADTLRQLGFQVIEVRDASRVQMTEAITRVRTTLQGKQGIGMLYYAGHGLQLEWRNFMVPVDAKISSSADIAAQAVDVGSVIDAFKAAGNRMNIVVLDACRDNPFAGTASGKGLAQIDAPPGTFLAFATAPGNLAIDGDVKSGNGLYTGFLLEELKKPAARIEDVFKRVRLNVRKQSKGRQIPWESTSLEDDFVFNTGVKVASRDERAREEAFRIEKADWDRIRDSKNADDFYAFLLKYPNGSIVQNATAALERLAVAQTVAVPDRNGIVQLSGAPRYRLGDEVVSVLRDMYTDLVIARDRLVVTRIADGIVELNGGAVLRSIDGGLIKTPSVRKYDPPRMDYPGDGFAIGKQWSSRLVQTEFDGRLITRQDTTKIVAFEPVLVSAGTFQAYRFEMDSYFDNGGQTRLTYWAQPDWPFPVKTIRVARSRNGPVIREVAEMASRKRGQG